MAFTGTLKLVTDKEKGWGILIDTDEKGKTWFTMWDKKFAGQESSQHEIICDVHDFIGQRVCFEATRGNLKDKAGPEEGERFNSTITAIGLEVGGPEKSVREMAEEITAEKLAKPPLVDPPDETDQVPAKEPSANLPALTMKMLNAIGEWAVEIERRTREA